MHKQLVVLILKHKVIIKYIIAGGTAATVDLSLLFVFTHFFKLYYLLSATLAFLIAFFVSFFLQKFWTFRDDSRDVMYKQMASYLLIALLNLAMNNLIMYLLVDKAKIWYMFAQVLAGGIVAMWSFLIYRFLIFNKPNNTVNDEAE